MKRTLLFLFGLGLLSAHAQFAQFPGDGTQFLSGLNSWTYPSVVSNSALAGSFTRTTSTLSPASGGTNYGVNLGGGSSGYIAMTNHVTVTGLTNNAVGTYYLLMIVNESGSDYTLRVPTTAYVSHMTTLQVPTVLTNGTAATVEVYGYGTSSTNALYRFVRYAK